MRTKLILNFVKISLYTLLILVFFSSCSDTRFKFGDWVLVVDSQNFPEGITYNQDGNLYSSNCNGNWITRIGTSKIDTFLLASDSTFTQTNGMISLSDGSILACDYGIGAIIRFSTNGEREIIVSGYDGSPLNRPNDLTLDQKGNLFFTDPSSYGEDKLDGRIFYHNFSKNKTKLIQSNLAFPNGIAISPIDKRLYVCESAKSRILSFSINEKNELEDKNVFIVLPGGDPDGINFDIEGNLYVAHFGGQAIYILSPNGKILHKLKTPGTKPSNVEFAGPDRKTLYITEDETNSIYKTAVDISGYIFNK